MIRLVVNGKPREVEGDAAIALTTLLEAFEVNPRHVAVAINGDVIPKTQFAESAVRDGDAVEIVRMVGGGSS